MIIFFFIFGCVIGSFLNVVIFRTRSGKSIVYPPSACPNCNHSLNGYDLIPVLSFLSVGGKCRYCKKAISWQYPSVELLTGLCFALAYIVHPAQPIFIARDIVLSAFFILLFVFDLRYKQIPDVFSLPAIVMATFFAFSTGVSTPSLLIAAAVIGGFFAMQYIVSRGRWVGDGDILLGVLMGIYLGLERGIFALWLAYVGGAIIISTLLILKKAKLGQKIPFGPFLIAGTIISYLFFNLTMSFFGLKV